MKKHEFLDNVFILDESEETEECEHEYDWDEGYTCLNCGEQGDIGAYIDDLEYTYGDDR